MAKENDL